MKIILGKKLKRVVTALLATASVTLTVGQYIPYVQADSSRMLGSSQALNSPILNNNFTSDNWNKWEMICWGVYLSNFCVPFIDNYQMAFSTGAGGSNGSGYNALVFGSGNDPTNNEIIKDFCDSATNYQASAGKQIYVGYTKLSQSSTSEMPKLSERFTPTDGDDTGLRQACVADLFFLKQSAFDNSGNKPSDDNTQWTNYKSYNSLPDSALSDDENAIQDLVYEEAYIPTFYIKSDGGNWVKILDYTQNIDLQCVGSLMSNIGNSAYSARITDEQLSAATIPESIKSYVDNGSGSPLTLDCFGNIVTSNSIVCVPAAVNPNLTVDKSVNMLNSWMVNGLTQTKDTSNLVSNIGSANGSSGFKDWFHNAYGFDGSSNGFGPGAAKFLNIPALCGTTAFNNFQAIYFDLSSFVGGSATYGDRLKTLYNQDINNDTYDMPLMFGTSTKFPSEINSKDDNTTSLAAQNTAIAACVLSNDYFITDSQNQVYLTTESMLHELEIYDGSKIDIFGDPICIGVDACPVNQSKAKAKAQAVRDFYNWLYQSYRNSSESSSGITVNKALVTAALEDVVTFDDFVEKVVHNDTIWKSFEADHPEDAGVFDADNTGFLANKDPANVWFDYGDNNTVNNETGRMIVMYPANKVLTYCGSVLGLQANTEFREYSTYLYMTYLDWYGIVNKTTFSTGTTATSKFDTNIYGNSDQALVADVTSITNVLSDDQMESKIRNYSFLMLSPDTEGIEYRNSVLMSGVSKFIYQQYEKVVYGGAKTTKTFTSSNNSGFLNVPMYEDNIFTKAFLKLYVKIAVLLVGFGVLLLVITGIIKTKKNISWWFFGMISIISIVLLLPSVSDLTPVAATAIINRMYSPKMTYWSLSEEIANASLEANLTQQSADNDGLSDEETATVMKVVSNLSSLHADRSLMIKQDISQKLTQQLGGAYSEIQSLPSARWLLPTIMQQYTTTDGQGNVSTDAVYVSLSNVLTDCSNMYWYMYPNDAAFVTKPTSTSSQFATSVSSYSNDENGTTNKTTEASTADGVKKDNDQEGYTKLSEYFGDYKEETWADDTNTDVNYANYSYTVRGNASSNETESGSSDMDSMVHLYGWCDMVKSNGNARFVPSRVTSNFLASDNYEGWTDAYKDPDSWIGYIRDAGDYIKSSSGDSLGVWNTNSTDAGFDAIADTYDRTDASTIKPSFSYYRNTESILYYFFDVVKDSFDESTSLGGVIGQLQGTIENKYIDPDDPDYDAKKTAQDHGDENYQVRNNFMYATVTTDREQYTKSDYDNQDVQYTGWTRDVLDLQELFTNVVPYLYQTTLATGGFSGEDADSALAGMYISAQSDYYKGSPQSWAYRCNWAVKLMENPNYCKAMRVYGYDENGKRTRYMISNPIMPSAYPDNRPMIFSEAQMYAYGLTENDLNLVELKCVRTNEAVVKDWTSLINYAGTDGLTKESLFRQMAVDAAIIFNQNLSNTDMLNNKYAVYPQSLDLRYLSFDSIMKILIVNATKNSSYVGGDTVEVLLDNTDIFTGGLLLISAFLWAFTIPLFQEFLLAFIFYLSILAMVRTLLASGMYKVKVACGQLVSNAMFIVITIISYGLVALLSSITQADEVLSLNRVQSDGGSPVWVLIIIIVIAALYMTAMANMIRFCYQNRYDMGYSAYSGMLHSAVDGISGAFSGFASTIGGFFAGSAAGSALGGFFGSGLGEGGAADAAEQKRIEAARHSRGLFSKTENQASSTSSSSSTSTKSTTTTDSNTNDSITESAGNNYNNNATAAADEESTESAETINAEIRKGHEMEKKEESTTTSNDKKDDKKDDTKTTIPE